MALYGTLLLCLWMMLHAGLLLLPRTPHAKRAVVAILFPALWFQAFRTVCVLASGWRVVSVLGAVICALVTLSLLAGASTLLPGPWRAIGLLLAMAEPSIAMLILLGLDRHQHSATN